MQVSQVADFQGYCSRCGLSSPRAVNRAVRRLLETQTEGMRPRVVAYRCACGVVVRHEVNVEPVPTPGS